MTGDRSLSCEPFTLKGDVTIVTGGAGLLGEHVSRGLAGQGATVVVADVDIDAATRIQHDTTGDVHVRETDVTETASIEALVDDVLDRYGQIDTLVNCAYPRNENYGQPYEDVGADDWRENVELHLGSYYLACRAVTPVMVAQDGGGSIVNFGSTYGVQAPDFSVYDGTEMTSPVEYAAIKGGILNLTRYLASYLGEDGVRVNAVSPGGVFDEQHPTFVENYERRTPLGRMAEPEDIVGPVVFLASDAAGYVTGHNLRVDGGWTIC